MLMTKEETASIDEMCKRLNVLISIMLTPKIQDLTNYNKIAYLASHGFTNIEIANILNTSTSVVAKEKSIQKKDERK